MKTEAVEQQDRRCIGITGLAVEDLDPIDHHRLIRRHLVSHSVGAAPRSTNHNIRPARTAILTIAARDRRSFFRWTAPRTAFTEELSANQ
jgi:hypothetical protein